MLIKLYYYKNLCIPPFKSIESFKQNVDFALLCSLILIWYIFKLESNVFHILRNFDGNTRSRIFLILSSTYLRSTYTTPLWDKLYEYTLSISLGPPFLFYCFVIQYEVILFFNKLVCIKHHAHSLPWVLLNILLWQLG